PGPARDPRAAPGREPDAGRSRDHARHHGASVRARLPRADPRSAPRHDPVRERAGTGPRTHAEGVVSARPASLTVCADPTRVIPRAMEERDWAIDAALVSLNEEE